MRRYFQRAILMGLAALTVCTSGCSALANRRCRKAMERMECCETLPVSCSCEKYNDAMPIVSSAGPIDTDALYFPTHPPLNSTASPAQSGPTFPSTTEHPTPPPRQPLASEADNAPGFLRMPGDRKPASLTLRVGSMQAISQVNNDVTFQIMLENQGETPIETVELTATVSENLRILAVIPENAATIKGSTATFAPLKNFTPMTLSYQISARVLRAGDNIGRLKVEVKSPILTSGPLQEEAMLRITGN